MLKIKKMNQTNSVDLAKELQALEAHLERVIQSPEFVGLRKSNFYNPDTHATRCPYGSAASC